MRGGEYGFFSARPCPRTNASIGYQLLENTWIAAGYNVLDFNDGDFAGSEYRAKGFFFSVRIKFDQDTLGLNKSSSTKLPWSKCNRHCYD